MRARLRRVHRWLSRHGGQLAWRVLAATARPSQPISWPRGLLVAAAHPDDDVLGAGGTVALLAGAGLPVTVLIASDGSGWPPVEASERAEVVRLRHEEELRAVAELGLQPEDVVFLDLPDAQLARHETELTGAVGALLDQRGLQTVVSTAPTDPHADHAALARCVSAAAAAVDPPPAVWWYPVWQHRSLRRTLATLRAYGRPAGVDVRTQLPDKRRALSSHASQLVERGAVTGGLTPEFVEGFLRRRELFFRRSARQGPQHLHHRLTDALRRELVPPALHRAVVQVSRRVSGGPDR